jgi:hypothetical protein
MNQQFSGGGAFFGGERLGGLDGGLGEVWEGFDEPAVLLVISFGDFGVAAFGREKGFCRF